MRTWFPQFRVMSVLTGLSLVSGLCGASPQEGRVPRSQASAPREQPAFRPAPAPTPVAQPSGDPDNRLARVAPGYQASNHQGSNQRGSDQPLTRAHRVGLYPGTHVVIPPPFWRRCTIRPTARYWGLRDLSGELQWLSRTGNIPVSPIGDTVDTLSDFAWYPSGWRAYGIAVPVGGTVQVEVEHSKLGWFRLLLVDQWGRPGPGMLEASVAHQPVLVTYKNPNKVATAIYVIVDDPAWWSDAQNPYTLLVRRDWDAANTDLSQVKMVSGLWGATPSVSAQFRRPSLTGPAVYPH